METHIISARGKEVIIGDRQPTVLIGEKINPFGKGPIKDALISGDMGPIREEAAKQVEAGADILIISVAAFGIDETMVLPNATKAVMETVDVPLCLESRSPVALENTLRLGCGKPIISSVTGEAIHLDQLLPLVKQYNTAFVALASDSSGVPNNAARRLEIISGIVERAREMGIDAENVIADCVAESSAINSTAAIITLETMEMVKRQRGLNLVLGASNVSFGLPNRTVINAVFLSLAVSRGLTSAIVNAKLMKPYIMAADLLMGRDNKARRYTTYCRKLLKANAQA
jgi:5-methyltetrahydrofolate--homocysteine methyltransferase